jgi:glucose-1-phosphate adenylyltransferase
MRDVLAVVLAGGEGKRLEALTIDRAKPAVPFGGAYRIIDFTLSNCVNSGLRQILVLTQYKAASLERHLQAGWHFLARTLDEYVDVLSPQQRLSKEWYLGTADAVYQNIYSIEREKPKYVLVLSGDHVYKMDYRRLIEWHQRKGGPVTLSCVPMDLRLCREFGVVRVDADWRIREFLEKPAETEPLPDDPQRFLASMGVYVFDATFLYDRLCRDAVDPDSARDFGRNVIPAMVRDSHLQLYAYPFRDERTGAMCYWRDVGTVEALYEANMDLLAAEPPLDLYDREWPIFTYRPPLPPARIEDAVSAGSERRQGQLQDSIVCEGAVITGGCVEHSVVSANVRVRSGADVRDSVLFEGVQVGSQSRVRRAIVDRHVTVPPGTHIGWDRADDEARGLPVTSSGIVVVPKGFRFRTARS